MLFMSPNEASIPVNEPNTTDQALSPPSGYGSEPNACGGVGPASPVRMTEAEDASFETRGPPSWREKVGRRPRFPQWGTASPGSWRVIQARG